MSFKEGKRECCRPKLLVTQTAERTVKAAAKLKRPFLFAEIKDLNLIAKEFKYHDKCYKDFTRNINANNTDQNAKTSTTYSTGNFEIVKNMLVKGLLQKG